MDPSIDRLVSSKTSGCRTGGNINLPADPETYQPCLPDNAAFHRLAAQYAFAFAPTAMHSARTTGVGGWHVGMEASYTTIDAGADYWKSGSRGAATLAEGNAQNRSPASVLQLYSVKLRKGFGYGFEIAAQTGFMPQTSLWSAGADVRISLLEGFRKGVPGYIPDIAVGGGVRTITGTPQFQLTVASLDLQISKPLVVADALVLTPWLGYQQMFAWVDSNVIDLTPSDNAEELCEPRGQAVPGQLNDAKSTDEYTGKVVCKNAGGRADYMNNRAFGDAFIVRKRILVGANLRHEHLMFGLQFITDLFAPDKAQSGSTEGEDLAGMPRQMTFVLDAGLMF